MEKLTWWIKIEKSQTHLNDLDRCFIKSKKILKLQENFGGQLVDQSFIYQAVLFLVPSYFALQMT